VATEDFTTYTEQDHAANAISIDDANTITVTEHQRDYQDETWVVKDKTADHFSSDFTHTIKLMITAKSGEFPLFMPWLIANQVDSWDDIRSESDDDQDLSIYNDKFRIGVVENGGYTHSDTANSYTQDVQYYITVERDDDGGVNNTGRLTMRIHTVNYYGEAGSVELETETVDCAAGQQNDFQYIYAVNGYYAVANTSYYSYVVEDLDLNEGAPSGAIPLLVGGGMGQTMGSNCNLMTG